MKYNYIYTHHNGAKIYENEKGRKKIYYDDIEFSSIGAVNRYIAERGIKRYKSTDKLENEQSINYKNYREDYYKLKDGK